MTRSRAVLTLLLACACRPTPAPPPDAAVKPPHDVAAPVWPAGLLEDVTEIRVSRTRGNEPLRTAHLVQRDGGWRMVEPFRGTADPDALSALRFSLRAPQVLRAHPAAADGGSVAFDLRLVTGDGGTRHLRTFQTRLGTPVLTEVEGVGTFEISPTEFANSLPDPADFAPPGLWIDAPRSFSRLTVRGKTSYELTFDGGEWHAKHAVPPQLDLEDFAGVLLGREATAHLSAPLSALGLDPPRATVTLCAGTECREFRFGTAQYEGQTGYFAIAPDADPIAIHPPDWALVVNGPFAPRR